MRRPSDLAGGIANQGAEASILNGVREPGSAQRSSRMRPTEGVLPVRAAFAAAPSTAGMRLCRAALRLSTGARASRAGPHL